MVDDQRTFRADPLASRAEDCSATFFALTACFLLFQFLLVCLSPPVLFDPDESLFASVARDMLATGDYWTPRYQDKPFLDRPAMYYWLLAASVHQFGDTDLSYRLPSLLLGAGTVVLIGLIAREVFGRASSIICGFVAATMAAQPVLSIGVTHDSALTFFVTASVYTGLRRQSSTGSARMQWGLLAGVFLGLACLAKGLLGIGLPAMAFVSYAIAFRRPGDCRSLGFMLGAAIVIAAGWYAFAEWRQPGYLRYFLVDRHLRGFLTDSQRHGGRSILVYVAPLLFGGFPWAWLLARHVPNLARTAVGRIRDRGCLHTRRTPGVVFAAGWLIATVAVFLLAGSKNPSYLFPAYPPAALLAGWELAHRFKTRVSLRTLCTVTAAACVLLTFSVTIALPIAARFRSSKLTIDALRQLDRSTPVIWFNHVPPSARLYGADLDIRRVYYQDLVQPPARTTVLVTRESRLEEVLPAPFVRHATHIDIGGKFHLLVCPAVEIHSQSVRNGEMPAPPLAN